MNYNETCVLIVLAVCCFTANVLHGLTGCGSILVLHILWQTVITVAPDVMHGTDAFSSNNVKSIAEFSYVLTFFIQLVLTGLLFLDEHRKRAQQREHDMPLSPSELNGVLLLAFIPCSFIGAGVGVLSMPAIQENGSRIILGGSSLFFALTFLSLYQMKYLEKKKTEDVIRDDLMLMRIQSEVQRHVILQYMEEQKRRKARRERRARHYAQRQQARRAARLRRRELRKAAPLTLKAVGEEGGGSGSGSGGPSPVVVVPAGQDLLDGLRTVSAGDGGPLESNVEFRPFHLVDASRRYAGSPSEQTPGGGNGRVSYPLEVHGPSHAAAPHAHLISDVHLPTSVTGDDGSGGSLHRHPTSPGRHRRLPLHRHWVKEVDVHRFIRQRLAEISRDAGADDDDDKVATEARVAAWTLRAMAGNTGADRDGATPVFPGAYSSGDTSDASSGSSSSSSSTDSDAEEGDGGTDATSSTPGGGTRQGRRRRRIRSGDSAITAASESSASTAAAAAAAVPFSVEEAERAALHHKWRALLGKGTAEGGANASERESVDLTKSIARAAATAPRRVIMGHAEILNIGLREAQQQQLRSLREHNLNEYADEHKRHRLVHFMRMDGGVVMSAMVSAFFSGLFGTYTGVADPPLSIFALAMGISVSELRINYAVSSIFPAALRAVVGIHDEFANKNLLVYYVVAVVFAWAGVAFGLHISHNNAVSQATFMVAILATLVLIAFLMLVPTTAVLLRLAATAAGFIIVALAVVRQQKKPERHRPPAPPNTPATQAEVDAFALYWRQRSRKNQALLDYERDGSVLSLSTRSTSEMEESLLGAAPSPAGAVAVSASVPAAKKASRARESEDVRRRTPGAAEEEEECITIVPVKAH